MKGAGGHGLSFLDVVLFAIGEGVLEFLEFLFEAYDFLCFSFLFVFLDFFLEDFDFFLDGFNGLCDPFFDVLFGEHFFESFLEL